MSSRLFSILLWTLVVSSSFVVAERQLRGSGSAVLCRMTIFDTMDSSGHAASEVPMCIPIVDNVEMDSEYDISLPQSIRNKYEGDLQLGKLFVELTGAVFQNDTLAIRNDASYKVVTDEGRRRNLLTDHLQIQRNMSVAIISISTVDAKPTYTAKELADFMFGDGINLRQQYVACSFGKQNFYPSEHLIDEYVDAPISSFERVSDLVNTAQKQIRQRATPSITSVSELADRIMVCIPPGTGNWAASAGVGHWRVQMNNNWCTSLTGTIHEMAHTRKLLSPVPSLFSQYLARYYSGFVALECGWQGI